MLIHVRDILSRPKEQQILPVGPFQLQFDDGETIDTRDKEIIYSNFFWDIHREYPNTPLLKKHHVRSVLKNNRLSGNTHINLFSNILADVVGTYNLHKPEQKEHVLDMIYRITNNIHNEVTKMAEEYVNSVDILDFLEVINHPEIKRTVDSIQPNPDSISATYRKVEEIINNDPALDQNALAIAVRSGSVNSNQVMQCVAVRGFPSEVDGHILPEPIFSNYTKGMNRLYDLVADSRSAAKSLYFSEAPLQDAEYFARRLQLLAMSVERIDYVDCGSKQYLNWRVMPPTYNEHGAVVYPGDLAFLIGKYYLDEDSHSLKEITHIDPGMYHKVLKLRSVLFCKHPDPHSVCEVCFGGLSKNVSRFANLGHLCSATMTKQTSQSVLSTKHLDASSVSSHIILNEQIAKFFTTNKAKNAYILKKEHKDKNIKIIVNREEAVGLIDILSVNDIRDVNPSRVSSIEYIELVYGNDNEELSLPMFIGQDTRRAMLTIEFMKYLKIHKWETDSRNNFVFTLKGWDFSLPIFRLPDMEYSYSDHSHQIARVIESSMKKMTERAKPNSPISTLQELFTLVNTKLEVSMPALEVIIYAIMQPNKDSYALARNVEQPMMGVAKTVIKNRSLGGAYAFEDQISTITGARSFFKLDRPDSVFDVFIAPDEVIKHHNAMTH